MSEQTPVERFIDEQLSPYLVEGESAVARAYLTTPLGPGWLTTWRARAYHMAVTETRLMAFEARVGALRPLLENRSTYISRLELVTVTIGEHRFEVEFPGRKPIKLLLADKSKHSSTQAELIARLTAGARREMPRAIVKKDRQP